MNTYVYVNNTDTIKLKEQITEDDKGIVYMGEFESLEKAKEYHRHCIEDQFSEV